MKKERLIEKIEEQKTRSAWTKGVKDYAFDLVESLDEINLESLDERRLLNGADNWLAYSCGGCSLICDWEIAERLCSPSELKRKNGGELPPNRGETWLDVQARACTSQKSDLTPVQISGARRRRRKRK